MELINHYYLILKQVFVRGIFAVIIAQVAVGASFSNLAHAEFSSDHVRVGGGSVKPMQVDGIRSAVEVVRNIVEKLEKRGPLGGQAVGITIVGSRFDDRETSVKLNAYLNDVANELRRLGIDLVLEAEVEQAELEAMYDAAFKEPAADDVFDEIALKLGRSKQTESLSKGWKKWAQNWKEKLSDIQYRTSRLILFRTIERKDPSIGRTKPIYSANRNDFDLSSDTPLAKAMGENLSDQNYEQRVIAADSAFYGLLDCVAFGLYMGIKSYSAAQIAAVLTINFLLVATETWFWRHIRLMRYQSAEVRIAQDEKYNRRDFKFFHTNMVPWFSLFLAEMFLVNSISKFNLGFSLENGLASAFASGMNSAFSDAALMQTGGNIILSAFGRLFNDFVIKRWDDSKNPKIRKYRTVVSGIGNFVYGLAQASNMLMANPNAGFGPDPNLGLVGNFYYAFFAIGLAGMVVHLKRQWQERQELRSLESKENGGSPSKSESFARLRFYGNRTACINALDASEKIK